MTEKKHRTYRVVNAEWVLTRDVYLKQLVLVGWTMTFTSQERDASSSASLVPTPPGCSLFQQPSAVCPHKEKCNPAGRIRFRISSTSVQIDSAQLASFFFFVCWQ